MKQIHSPMRLIRLTRLVDFLRGSGVDRAAIKIEEKTVKVIELFLSRRAR